MQLRNLLMAIMILMVVSACVTNPTSTNSASVQVDNTFGRYEENLEQRLILITVTPEYHARLTNRPAGDTSDALPEKYNAFLQRMNHRYGLSRVADWPLASIDIFCIIFEETAAQNRETLLAALDSEEGVESAQLVQTFQTQGETYNDPYLSLQHGLESIQAIGSHDWSRGKGVRVAVIDTGTDITHPDLADSTELTKNFVDNDEKRFRTDVHGTAVGGIIAAAADNSTGIVGVAPDARLLALKSCWHPKTDKESATCNTLTLAKALNFSISQQVDIINLSLTGPPDPLLNRLVAEAIRRNIIVIGAQPAHAQPAFPISVPGTIAVSAANTEAAGLSAPGRRVLSTHPGRQYNFFNGSSFASAHIAGLAAVIRSLAPSIKPAELLELLEQTADEDTGSVNACRAAMTVGLSDSISDDRALQSCI
jgi:hypothetical protein